MRVDEHQSDLSRWRIQVKGAVQGVGFRPFVYRLAKQYALTGTIYNSNNAVIIEVQGKQLQEFTSRLQSKAVNPIVVTELDYESIALNKDEHEFSIGVSASSTKNTAANTNLQIPVDRGICQECLGELFDPQSRFYHYPFISCTACGPRYTAIESFPYDREHTTFVDFPRCQACQQDYNDPTNRRFHAETFSCEHCGPQLSHSIETVKQRILAGEVLLIKGIGGYHFVCDAANDKAVMLVRRLKQRPGKPLALMVANIASAEQIAVLSSFETELISSSRRPIVLLTKKTQVQLSDLIAPRLSRYGVMLPYSGFYYLLFHTLMDSPEVVTSLEKPCPLALCVTSANRRGEPLVIDDCLAQAEFSDKVSAIITYPQRITARADDSIVQQTGYGFNVIRHARAIVGEAIPLAETLPDGLALGGHLKNTFCVVRGKEAFLSAYQGDLDNSKTINSYRESLWRMLRLLAVKPAFIACDSHPDFYSTRFAYELADQFNVPYQLVQHHHAHAASVAAEQQVTEAALALVLDGYGYGIHGEAWGGELLKLEGAEWQRLAHLHTLKQPGGEQAAKEPWRMAASVLFELGLSEEITNRFNNQQQAKNITRLLETSQACASTSSCGRLFDAVSALLNVCLVNQHEGQAAMELEALVTEPVVLDKAWSIKGHTLNLLPLLEHLLDCDPVTGANVFHGTLAAALADWITLHAKHHQLKTILLSGGCFLNRVLAEQVCARLIELNLKPVLPEKCPVNDSGLSLGQAWLAGQGVEIFNAGRISAFNE